MENTTTSPATETATTFHVFGHLGPAPYRYIGHRELKFQAFPGAPVKAGGSCDHCAAAIVDAYYFRAANGVEFKVGSSCVLKSGDRGMVDKIKRAANKIKTERRHASEKAAIDEARVQLADEAIRAKLAAQPHPGRDGRPGDSFAEKTLLDWAEWMMRWAGNRGRMRVARTIAAL